MARKKEVSEEKAAEKVVEAPLVPMPAQKPVVKIRMVQFKSAIHHPDVNRWVPENEPLEFVLDNWVKSQIKAGLIEVIE